MLNDISKHYTKPTYIGSFVAKEILKYEGTPNAIKVFNEHAHKLDDYSYWFFLSTCWVSYTGWSDLHMWKELFGSDRPKRKDCVMKPSEVRRYDFLPPKVTIYRAHRPNEEDWIAYTLDLEIAKRFAAERGVTEIKQYLVNRKDILALFLRRGEQEVIVLDKTKIIYQQTIQLEGEKVW